MSHESSSALPFTDARITVEGTLFNGRGAKLVIPGVVFSSPEGVIFTDAIEDEEIRGDDSPLSIKEYHTIKLEIEGKPLRKNFGDHYVNFYIEENEA